MIIAGNQSTKLAYNLVHSKDRGSSFQRRGCWSWFLAKIWIFGRGWVLILGVGAAALDQGPWIGGGSRR